ncbi:MAG: flavodoxin family protein [Sulfolobales archaeon]|jgi:multimeric flavodoxin WrbA|nr:flavodoxin family protein [Desulfurococcaceae archaeon]
MVKVLGINGSPRPYGNSFQALKLALRAAELEGAEVELVNLYEYEIKPCLGCVSDDIKACVYPCPINDDMVKLYPKVIECDALIISSPIYWFGVSGLLKNFLDRLTVLENMIYVDGRSWLDGKVVGFIAVGNDEGAVALISNLMAVTNSFGMVIPPWALAYYVGEGNALEDPKLLLDSANVGRIVTLMAQVLKGLRKPPTVWYRADDHYRELIHDIATEIRSNVEDELGISPP